MKPFTDNKGRKWTVDVNVGTAKKVRAGLNVDLLDFEGAIKAFEDPMVMVDVIWLIVEGQHDVTDEEFGAALAGDAVEAASTALLEALVDFFPKRRREILAKALAKSMEIDEAMLNQAAAAMETITLETLTSGMSSGEAPES